MTELSTTNVWLAVLAVAAILQSATMFLLALIALRTARRIESALTRAGRTIEALEPRLSTALDDLHWLIEAGRRADDSVRATVTQVSNGMQRARSLMSSPFRLVRRAGRAAHVALSASNPSRNAAALNDDDRRAVEDFIAEGAPAQSSR